MINAVDELLQKKQALLV